MEYIEERLSDKLVILQNNEAFKYGTDAVILAKYSAKNMAASGRVLDIGTGTGIVPLLLSEAKPGWDITGLEIQPDMAEMAAESVRMNCLEQRVNIVCGDIRRAVEIFGKAVFDAITTNPPYKRAGSGLLNNMQGLSVARHEIEGTLEDFIRVSVELLKPGGSFYMVNRPDRLADTIEFMRKYKLEPRNLQMVQDRPEKKPVMFLIKGVRGGGRELKVEAPLILKGQ